MGAISQIIRRWRNSKGDMIFSKAGVLPMVAVVVDVTIPCTVVWTAAMTSTVIAMGPVIP